MSRPVQTTFVDKVRRVQEAVTAARGAARRHFGFGEEVAPGVRLVLSEAGSRPLVFSLWTLPQDIATLCSDASVPATAALLAVDSAQAREVTAAGHTVDLGQFSRSQSNPELYYALFDHVSQRQIHTLLHRLVPALAAHAPAA
ncbi:hypothetical protein [Zavarzinia sp.]|uniref:hypothetical protein n=1 Tax=Zavarzinia sp. TaxID=2027920 RepID=UPI0035628676